ncbi:MAG: ABC transporter substrate-binding protein [Trueperaceae bacterium]|nr:ABC transporter substrate-binding protein [Trueperaceae bacterium]
MTGRFRPLLTLIAIGVLALGLGSLGLAQSNRIVYAQSVPVTTLDPAHGAFLAYPAGYEVAFAIYDRLVTFDETFTLAPQLATGWTASDDGLTWTFTLREGVTFHDGTPFDAAAVVWNVERMIDAERNPTNRPLWNPVAGTVALDNLTVAITTHEPYSALLNTFAHGSGAIVSPAAAERYGDDEIATNPVGSGPFMLDSFNPGQEVVLKAFPDFWGEPSGTDELVFRYVPEASTRISALRTGEVDVIDSVPPQLALTLETDPNVQVLTTPGLRPMGFALMTERPPLDDVRVRQALNYAIPKDAISRGVFQGFARPANSPLAFNTVGHVSAGDFAFDPARAGALLDEAGWTLGSDGVRTKDGERLEFSLYTPEGLFPGDLDIAEIVASSLADVGVDVTITKIEAAGYWDELRKTPENIAWDIAQFGFNPSSSDGTYHLDSLFTSNPPGAAAIGAWNIVRYDNPEVDQLIAAAKTSIDLDARDAYLADVQRIVWADAPYLWLQVNEVITATRADASGVQVWPVIFTIVRDAHR